MYYNYIPNNAFIQERQLRFNEYPTIALLIS